MVCTTVRKDSECPFMAVDGCSYNGGICHEIIEQCSGCRRGKEYSSGWYCTACPDPIVKWKNGKCNLATNIVAESTEKTAKINPLKASKRGAS
jgi:hypothetical protein